MRPPARAPAQPAKAAGRPAYRPVTDRMPVSATKGRSRRRWRARSRLFDAYIQLPVMVSLCGCRRFGEGLLGAVVDRSFEALAIERVEVDAVGRWVIRTSSPAQTNVRQLLSPGTGPSPFVRRFTSPSERSSRFALRHLQPRRCRTG
jgi:hypothetical protein